MRTTADRSPRPGAASCRATALCAALFAAAVLSTAATVSAALPGAGGRSGDAAPGELNGGGANGRSGDAAPAEATGGGTGVQLDLALPQTLAGREQRLPAAAGDTVLFIGCQDLNNSDSVKGNTNLRDALVAMGYTPYQPSFVTITSAYLLRYFAVVYGGLRTISGTEAQAFDAYVGRGGKLLLVGNIGNGATTANNNLIGPYFGIEFSYDLLSDSVYHLNYNGGCSTSAGDPDNGAEYPLLNLQPSPPHPVGAGVSQFLLNWGQSLTLFGNATPVISSSVDGWGDTDFAYTPRPADCYDPWYTQYHDVDESGGPLVGVAAWNNTSGGKVVAVGDWDQWWNFFFDSYGNRTLFENIFQWFGPNVPPVLINPGTLYGTQGVLFSATLTASDSNGDPLTFSVAVGTSLPAWAALTNNGNGTATIRGTPTAAGTYPVAITVSDGRGGADTESFNIIISSVNRPPVVTNPGDRAGAENTPFTVTVIASDPDGDPLTLSGSNIPPWATFTDNGNRTATIAGTPDFTHAGTYTGVTVTANDGSASASTSFTITISNTNRPPVVLNPGDRTGSESTPFTVTVTASDPDGDALTMTGSNIPPWATFTDNGNRTATIAGTPDFTQAGTYTGVTVTANDGQGGTDAEAFTITIADALQPPRFTSAPSDTTSSEDDVVSRRIRADVMDSAILTYSAIGLPPGLAINAQTGLIGGRISLVAADGSPYAVRLRVDSNLGGWDEHAFTWTIQAVETVPDFPTSVFRLVSIPARTPAQGGPVRLSQVLTGLGAPGSSNWRGFGWENGALVEDPLVRAGQGFWLSTLLPVPSGLRVRGIVDPVTTVPLTQGWNIIGAAGGLGLPAGNIWVRTSPSQLPVPIADAVAGGLVSGALYDWFDETTNLVNDGEWVTTAVDARATLEPWDGRFVYAYTDCELILYRVEPASAGAGRTPGRSDDAFGLAWSVDIRAAEGAARSSAIRLGAAPRARDGWDPFDLPAPPPPGPALQIGIVQDDWGERSGTYLQSILPAGRDSCSWRIRVTGGRNRVTLSCVGLDRAPAGYQVWLVLPDGPATRLTADRPFEAPLRGGTLDLDLVVMAREWEGPRVESGFPGLRAVIPNPLGDGDLRILYQAPRAAEARVSIFDTTGRLVRNLGSFTAEPGSGERRWDGRDDAGHRVPPGLYFVRLSIGGSSWTGRAVVLR